MNQYFLDGVTHVSSDKQCGRCCDFSLLESSKSAEFLPPSNYPSSKPIKSPHFPKGRDIVNNPRIDTLQPIKLSYEILTCCTQTTCFNIITKELKVSETISYLKPLGVSSSLIDTVIDHATQNCNHNTAPILAMQSLPLSHVWIDGLFELGQFIETPMHHLFERMTKSLVEKTIGFLKYNKQWNKYCDIIKPILEEIRGLKFDYCHIESFW